ncbi:MAG TPA: gliding motility-associated C-terminal domain-containing protein [Flavisolibacter sp.]|nr:gliding motility-associated C-terminal domain-containing protein [Flavisolibacter sp.]
MRAIFCLLILVFYSFQGIAQVNLTAGLVAYYPFNGTASDASGNNHHGQLVNPPQLTTDRFGNANSAYLFDGINDYIRVADNGAFSTPNFSLVVWFQSHSDNLQNLVGKRNFTTVGGTAGAQYQFFINYPPFPGIGSNLVGNNSTCNNITASSYLNTNEWICRTKWYCAVITYDGSRHKIYIDGVLKRDEATSFNGFLSCNSDLRFGNWWQGDLLPFKGIMDDIRWYNRALNQGEVTALYNNFPNISGQCGISAGAGFLAPDTVCVNAPVSISNMSVGASSYYWNFCTANVNSAPTGTNLGNIGNKFLSPVYIDYVLEGGNYYAFQTNNHPGGLVRLNFGNSLLNTPTVTDLGTVGGIVPGNTEGIQVIKNEGKWYLIIVGGDPVGGNPSRIVKIELGTNINNNTPTGTNWGNIGNLAYPHDLYVFDDNGRWYGITVNTSNNTITRFDFSSSFSNTPTGVNLGNIGGLHAPTGVHAFKDNGSWFAFVTNANGNSLTRLNFGNSLLNTPTGVNLGNIGNKFHTPWDIYVMKYCGENLAFVINAQSNDLVKLDFGTNLTSTPSASSYGNIANLNFPHCLSKVFRVGADLYTLIPNAGNNTLSRLMFSGCTNTSLPNSTLQNPPAISYNQPGVYNINLTINDGLGTQASYCKPVVVVDNTHTPVQPKSLCAGDSIQLTSSKTSGNLWNTGSTSNSIYVKNPGIYWVQSFNGSCTNIDSFVVEVKQKPVVNLGADTSLCSSDSLLLDAGNPGSLYTWQGNQSSQTFLVKQEGLYYVDVSLNGCKATDSIRVAALSSPVISLTNDTSICKNGNVVLSATGGGSYSWFPTLGIANPTSPTTVAAPDTTTKYFLTVTNTNSCKAIDSVTVTIVPQPVVSLGTDTAICSSDSLVLDAGNALATYTWQNGQTSQTITVTQQGHYSVEVNKNGCTATGSISISILSAPAINLSSDTAICKTGSATLIANGGDSYSWFPIAGLSDAGNATTIASPDTTTWYYISATNANGCTAKDSVLVTVSPLPVFSVQSSKPVLCVGDSVVLSASGGDHYTWFPSSTLSDPNSSTTLAFPTSSTQYKVIISENNCNITDSVLIQLPVVDKPVTATTKSNDITCFQARAQLNANGGNRYLWQPSVGLSDSTSRNPFVSITQSTTYHVSITTVDGCQVYDSITVFVNKGEEGSGFPVPTAFTPNGDGKNDCFSVNHWGTVTGFSLNLYNRWGELVFHSDNPSKCWDGYYKGVLQPSDVYVYLIKAKTLCGDIFRKGTFALIR